MVWTETEIKNCISLCQQRVVGDTEFRKKLLACPEDAISEISGKAVPPGIRIKILESDPSYDFTFLLPDFISEELGDEALDEIHGGIASCGRFHAPDGCGLFTTCNRDNAGK